jgi:hypothetical protein
MDDLNDSRRDLEPIPPGRGPSKVVGIVFVIALIIIGLAFACMVARNFMGYFE